MFKPTIQILGAITHFRRMHDLFSGDVWRCAAEFNRLNADVAAGQPLNLGEAQFWARAMIRAFFAEVEGEVHLMGSILLLLCAEGQVPLSFAEQAVLREKSYRLRNGELEETDSFNRLLDKFRFNYRLFSRIAGGDRQLEVSDHRWGLFRSALAARDAITHPKDEAAFGLSAEAITQLALAIEWFTGQMQELFELFKVNVEEGDA